MKKSTASFTGHRKISNIPAISAVTQQEIIRLIETGVTTFLNGAALGFDQLTALLILDLKKEYPHIKLHMVLPCPPEAQTKKWRDEDKEVYYDILRRADEIITLSQHYYNGCMQARNRYLVGNSGHCICYLVQPTGGTAYTVKMALKSGLTIINIAEKML